MGWRSFAETIRLWPCSAFVSEFWQVYESPHKKGFLKSAMLHIASVALNVGIQPFAFILTCAFIFIHDTRKEIDAKNVDLNLCLTNTDTDESRLADYWPGIGWWWDFRFPELDTSGNNRVA